MDTASLAAVSQTSTTTSRTSGIGGLGAVAADNKSNDLVQAAANRYSSPIMSFDQVTGDIIWVYRDPQTGDTLYQSPARATLLYERSQRLAEEQNHGTKGSGTTVSIYG
jgi:hypothetical protein